MKLLFALLLVCVVVHCNEHLLNQGFTKTEHLFGTHFEKDFTTVISELEGNKQINLEWFKQIYAKASPELKQKLRTSFWDWIPIQPGNAYETKPLTWEGECFKQITASFTCTQTNMTIVVETKGKKSTLCSEFYAFSTREKGYLKVFSLVGSHKIHVKQLRQYEYQDLQQHGLRVLLFPLGVEGTAVSIYNTVQLFWDPNPNMVQNNVDFLGERMQWAMQKRHGGTAQLKDTDIKSGDYLAIARLDGLDPLIMWGTGGHTGHTAMALWFTEADGSRQLYICESTDAEGGILTYWPPPYGVIRTPFDQWVKQAEKANYLVSILRLAPQFASKFNEKAAQDFFFSVQGQPYGWHNFIFTFIDTEWNNLPRPVTPDMFEIVMSLAERLIPMQAKGSIYNFLIQGLNHRLNSSCTHLQCIYDIIDPTNTTLIQVATIPEQDSWRYGGNYSMVCDVFVFEMYKNSGAIGSLTNSIQATEQTPKDTYQMAMFDSNWQRPLACVETDPDLPYCQLMGDYVMTLPGYNSIPLYPTMNNYCPSLPPVYMRTANC